MKLLLRSWQHKILHEVKLLLLQVPKGIFIMIALRNNHRYDAFPVLRNACGYTVVPKNSLVSI